MSTQPPQQTPQSPQSPASGFDLTFRARLLLSMCALVILTGAVIIFVSYRGNRITTKGLADNLFREVSNNAATQTKEFVSSAAPVANSLDQLANQGLALDDLDRLAPQILAFLKANPGMTCVLYADESGNYASATRLLDGQFQISRSFIKDGKTHSTLSDVQPDGAFKINSQNDTSGYDPRVRPFYLLAKEKRQIAWTEPYMFFTQGLPGISCVVPIYQPQPSGALRGVFSVEFDLAALSRFITVVSLSKNSRVFLFTPDQTLLAHPNQRNIIGKGVKGKGAMLTLTDTGDPLVDVFRQHLQPQHLAAETREENETSNDRNYHFFEFTQDDVPYMASTTIFHIGNGQPWVVGAIAPQSDFLAPVWRTRRMAFIVAGIAVILAAAFAAFTAGRISRPVHVLIAFMKQVGAGDLDARADFRGSREFRELSIALNQMIADLRERLLLRTSLRVAMDVQQSLLPAADPVSPLLDVAGKSNYCDQTGGDYYDFIDVIDVTAVSKNQLLVAVADVMGHGLPAALVMATARAAIRTCVQSEHALAQIMTRTNQVLSADNRHRRFVTVSLLLIDAPTRTVRWASAGHDPAIVFDPATGTFSELEGGDIPLGLMEDTKYEEYTSPPLPPNSVLIIGTDGVWEMFDEEHKQYGKTRLQSVMRDNHTKTAAQIGAALEADLKVFRGKAIPIDDVTFVVIKFLPSA